MFKTDSRQLGDAKTIRCFEATMSGDYSELAIHENGNVKSKCLDAAHQLPDLLLGVYPRIVNSTFQLSGRQIRDYERPLEFELWALRLVDFICLFRWGWIRRVVY